MWMFRHKKLQSGARIAVVGGGPAGSSFTLFALYFAQCIGLDLNITIFEPRDFSRPGPWGCNMCAGLIPVRMLKPLEQIGVTVPARVIRNRISHYTLHTAAGKIQLPQPDPDGDVISVYRGNGPKLGPNWSDIISFDHFLLSTARSRGAKVVHERVTAISMRPRPLVRTRSGEFEADLVVLATGVNKSGIQFPDLDYRTPARRKMAQSELCLGEDAVRTSLGNSVHIFLPRHSGLKFGTLVPKGPCVNVSLMGKDLPSNCIDEFLALPDVAQLLPSGLPLTCGCRPHIAVGPARPMYADRFVAVGDASITRLYKNGIGTAMRTARCAADTAVNKGVDANAFRIHYAPLCWRIGFDNLIGRFLFSMTGLFENHGWFARSQLESIVREQNLPPQDRFHSRLLWGMFTGTYAYTQLLLMASHPGLLTRLLFYSIADFIRGGRFEEPVEFQADPPLSDDDAKTNIPNLGD